MQFLNHKGITVIASEAATNSFGRRHTISFVTNCAGYTDSTDGDHNSRYHNPRAIMEALSEGIELHFFEQLTLNDRGCPRVKIRRMSTLYSLHNEYIQEKRTLISTGKRDAVREKIGLPPGYLTVLKEYVSGDLWYSPSVDTKNRVVRTLIFGMSDLGVRHFAVQISDCSSVIIDRLFHLIAGYQANILKHTIQPVYSRYSTQRRTAQIDITLEWKNVHSGKQLNNLIEAIKTDRTLNEAGVAVLRIDGERYVG